jgi:hypothetical protein
MCEAAKIGDHLGTDLLRAHTTLLLLQSSSKASRMGLNRELRLKVGAAAIWQVQSKSCYAGRVEKGGSAMWSWEISKWQRVLFAGAAAFLAFAIVAGWDSWEADEFPMLHFIWATLFAAVALSPNKSGEAAE